MVKLDWEKLEKDSDIDGCPCYRCNVPGGWLVAVCNGALTPQGVTFVPDPGHAWGQRSGSELERLEEELADEGLGALFG
jgi:hypothetical protein